MIQFDSVHSHTLQLFSHTEILTGIGILRKLKYLKKTKTALNEVDIYLQFSVGNKARQHANTPINTPNAPANQIDTWLKEM